MTWSKYGIYHSVFKKYNIKYFTSSSYSLIETTTLKNKHEELIPLAAYNIANSWKRMS